MTNLIDAAPDLLKACQAVNDVFANGNILDEDEYAGLIANSIDEDEQQMWRKLRAAIAKATGKDAP